MTLDTKLQEIWDLSQFLIHTLNTSLLTDWLIDWLIVNIASVKA